MVHAVDSPCVSYGCRWDHLILGDQRSGKGTFSYFEPWSAERLALLEQTSAATTLGLSFLVLHLKSSPCDEAARAVSVE